MFVLSTQGRSNKSYVLQCFTSGLSAWPRCIDTGIWLYREGNVKRVQLSAGAPGW